MEKDITIGGMRVHYDVTGPEGAPAVVLMHGWGCDHTTVRSIAAILEPGLRVYSLDLPGHGRSDEPPTPWGVDEYTGLVEEFCRLNAIENPTLIGHSFGGRIGLLMASRNPIARMVLVDAAGIKPRRKPKYYIKVYSFKAAKRILPLVLGRKKGSGGHRPLARQRRECRLPQLVAHDARRDEPLRQSGPQARHARHQGLDTARLG